MFWFTFIAFLIFATALLIAGYAVWSVPQQQARDMVTARLRDVRAHMGSRIRTAPDLVRRQRRGSLAFLGDIISWLGVLRRVQDYIDQANLKYRAADVFVLSVLIAASAYFLLGALGLSVLLLRVLLTAALAALPLLYIMRVRSKRLKKFESHLPDAVDLFNRSMKAGHNIHAGLETLAAETLDPVRMEFKKVVEELALGSPLETTLHDLGRRVPLIDLKFFITGLILQRQTGANMVSVLESLSLLMRERLGLAARMKAHTAQQRFSAGLLCALPLVVALGMWFLKPEYIRLLYTDPTGSKFLTYAIISEIVGILVIRRIANVKY
jgi:tight adherence protein B